MLRLTLTLGLCWTLLLAVYLSTAQAGTLISHLNVDIKLHDTKQEVTEGCAIPDPEEPAKYLRVVGCWKPYAVPTKQGRTGVLHAITPKGWCDHNQIHTIGHEVMHVVGWHHGPQYTNPYFPDRPYGCSNGGYWNPPQDPRP